MDLTHLSSTSLTRRLRTPSSSSMDKTLRDSTSASSGLREVIASTRVKPGDLHVEIRTPSATTATESAISPVTASLDAALDPDPKRVAAEVDATLAPTPLVTAVEVEAVTTVTIVDAHQIEDDAVLPVVTATNAAMTVDMTTAEKVAVAIAKKVVVTNGAEKDVAARNADAPPSVVVALVLLLNVAEAPLPRMREEDPVLVIPASKKSVAVLMK